MQRLRVLFVCGRNQWRSPTAAAIYAQDPRLETRSAGLSPGSRHRVSRRDLEWADLVLVMERKHQNRLRELFAGYEDLPSIQSLDISDDFEFMDPQLGELIRDAVEPLLDSSRPS